MMPRLRVLGLALTLLLPNGKALFAADCVGVIPGGGSSAYWNLVRDGAFQAGYENGIEVYYRGPEREGDSEAQLRVIDIVVERGCKALVIAPAGKEIGERVAQLKQQGILSLYIDRDMGGDVLSVIATDNFKAGQQAAEHMARLLGVGGRVLMLRLSPDVVSTMAREDGFIQAARAAGLTVDYEGFTGANPPRVIEQLKRSTDYEGFFTANALTTTVTYTSLKRLGSAGRKVHVGFDSSELLVGALQRGEIKALVLQQAQQMGHEGVVQAAQVLRGKLPPREPRLQSLPVRIATQENLQQEEILRLLGYPLPQ